MGPDLQKRRKIWRWEFLAGLCLCNGWRTGVEIGVSTGRFTLNLCRTIPDARMICVDPWVAQAPRDVEGAETYDNWNHEENYRLFKKAVDEHLSDRVMIIRAFSLDAVKQIEDNSVDFVFIDGDHTYEGAKNDIEAWGAKVRPGGLISGHDFEWPTVERAVRESSTEFEVGPDNVFYWLKR